MLRCPGWERGVLPGAGQSRCFDGGPEEAEEDHLQPSPAVRTGAGLRRDSLPGHHPEGAAGRAHAPAREQDTGESAARGSEELGLQLIVLVFGPATLLLWFTLTALILLFSATEGTLCFLLFLQAISGIIECFKLYFHLFLVRKPTKCNFAPQRMTWHKYWGSPALSWVHIFV